MTIDKLDLDGMFKMAFRLSDKLILSLLGSLFEDDYTTSEDVTLEYGNSEFIGDHLERLRSDIEITIRAGNLIRNYHIEFQTENDSSMVIRMFRYGFEKSMELLKVSKEKLHIRLEFPKQLVIFLEENTVIEDFLEMDIILPDGNIIPYKVPVFKLWEYDLVNLKKRNLYLLIPFKVFDFRKNIQNIVSGSRSEVEKKRLIMGEFEQLLTTVRESALIARDLYFGKEIDAHDLEQMLLIINNLTEYLYQKYPYYQEKPLSEEVGKLITTLFDPIVLEKGKEEGKLDVAKNMLSEGMELQVIVKITGLAEKEILKLKEELNKEKH
jgi:hypothetical protein